MKRRILFVGEATPLATGFSTYWRNVIEILYNSNKFIIAEFGSYMSTNDKRGQDLKWKFYGAMPDLVNRGGKFVPDPEQNKVYNPGRVKENQFGLWKFDSVVADFQPDIVCTLRDWWMDQWIEKSAFRSNFKWIHMACVDGHPQRPEWMETYKKVDTLLSYSKYGQDVLGEQGATCSAIASPGVNTNMFRPGDKVKARKALGLNPDTPLIGTVMRNQERKLFPRLLQAYKQFILAEKKRAKKARKTDTLILPELLLHTSIPDRGWDIELEVARLGLAKLVNFSYVCHSCGAVQCTKWQGQLAKCKHCGKDKNQTPNTSIGFTDPQLNVVYNAMDLYVQTSICEGWGMPISEAKSCGIPAMMVDWSAMSERANKKSGGIPIKVETTFTDNGTMQRRALFSREDLAKKLSKFFNSTEESRKSLSDKARASVLNSWLKAAQVWHDAIVKVDIVDREKGWKAPSKVREIPNTIDATKSREEIIRFLYTDVLNTTVDEQGLENWMKNPLPIENIIKFFYNKALQEQAKEKMRVGHIERSDNILYKLDPSDTMRILLGVPKTAGDILVATGITKSLKEKWPEASIYFACEEGYNGILEGNPYIKGILPWNDGLFDYRTAEGFADQGGHFDICFTPTIITQRIGHWLHNGHGGSMGEAYARMCNVSYQDPVVKPVKPSITEMERVFKEGNFITVHSGSSVDIKNYKYWADILWWVKDDITVVHVGTMQDPEIKTDRLNFVDIRGKTSPMELAYVLSKAHLHIGPDSFPGHLAASVDTNVVTLFGSTYSKSCMPRPSDITGYVDEKQCNFILGKRAVSVAINPSHRGDCFKPCHFPTCPKPVKCIDYIKPYDDVVKRLKNTLFYKDYFKEIA